MNKNKRENVYYESERTQNRTPYIAAPMGAILTLFIGYLDYRTSPEFAFMILYLLPVSFVTWFGGRTMGVIFSFFCVVVRLLADRVGPIDNSHLLVPYWNATLGLTFFLVQSVLLSSLKISLTKEKRFSRADLLTGLCNSRCFTDMAWNEIARARRYRHPFSVAYMDVDNFKTVNDMMGHAEGDRLLRIIGDTLRSNLRETDVVSRHGGDEFVCLLPETDDQEVRAAIEKIRNALKSRMQIGEWPVTFSIGVATFNQPPDSLDVMMKKTDELMYRVKNNGKNGVEFGVVL